MRMALTLDCGAERYDWAEPASVPCEGSPGWSERNRVRSLQAQLMPSDTKAFLLDCFQGGLGGSSGLVATNRLANAAIVVTSSAGSIGLARWI
jgi:hypothetical protein